MTIYLISRRCYDVDVMRDSDILDAGWRSGEADLLGRPGMWRIIEDPDGIGLELIEVRNGDDNLIQKFSRGSWVGEPQGITIILARRFL
jgi:hypothetical protein